MTVKRRTSGYIREMDPTLEQMAGSLVESGNYRVTSRVEAQAEYHPPDNGPKLVAAVVDVGRRAPIPTASALQSDRQRIAVGYPDVHPNSSIDAQKKTAAEPLQKHTARPLPSYGRFHYTAPTDQTDQTLFTLAKKRRRAGNLALLSFIHRPARPQPASGIRSRDTSLFTLLSSL